MTIIPINKPLNRPIRLGVLISGGGTTMANFIEKIADGSLNAEISIVIASSNECSGLKRAKDTGLPTAVVARGSFSSAEDFSAAIFEHLTTAKVDLVTLAGFLCLICVPKAFRHRVMNIHPALIPSFCGRGFFGHKVHEAAVDRGVKMSGCTVHFVDDEYDHGPIIVQKCVPVEGDDTPDSLASRVFEAECDAYPEAIRLFAAARLEVQGRRVRVLPPITD